MSDLRWKPGPPPLDRPGHYRIAWFPEPGHQQVLFCEIDPTGNIGIAGPWGPVERHQIVMRTAWHFGPIPDPPRSGETDNESTPL